MIVFVGVTDLRLTIGTISRIDIQSHVGLMSIRSIKDVQCGISMTARFALSCGNSSATDI